VSFHALSYSWGDAGVSKGPANEQEAVLRVGDTGSGGPLCVAAVARAASLVPFAGHLVAHTGATHFL